MTAASRYAQALFALASEGQQQSAVSGAVASLSAALSDATVAAALTNAGLTAAQRSTLAASMAKAVKAPAVLTNTLGVLATNNRLPLLPAILSTYQDLTDTAAGVTHVRLSSAAPLTDAQRTKLTAMLTTYTKASGIRLEESLDPALQGGFRAFFNGSVWDASLAGSLARIATRLRHAVTQRQA